MSRTPKSLVLFSDGTGNSAAAQFKTNVWRLYQTLDLSRGDVFVKYDAGVGTEMFKPLRMLGGAFGYGLAANVKSLYAFLCRNYEDGDQIYAFGFSRGAFTIRILISLISKCGLFTCNSETELRENVNLAFMEYRRDFIFRTAEKRTWHGISPYFPWLWRPYFLKRPRYHKHEGEGPDPHRLDPFRGQQPHPLQKFPPIKFLGLWDTVDGYGMPIDELKHGLDRWVWPMTFADRTLSGLVHRARHALSLDDERPTFRPVLWTEDLRCPKTDERPTSHWTEQPRIKQVWFAGVHANVGGGYPNDDLALVSLNWMMDEAERDDPPLKFLPANRDAIREHMNAHGQYYDSRAGVAGYYRYRPRSVAELCDDTVNGVQIKQPRIHRCVFERIAGQHAAYSPVSLPKDYAIEEVPLPPGKTLDWLLFNWPFASPIFPENGTNEERFEKSKLALNAVWRRQFTYLATVLASALLILFPFITWLGLWPLTAAMASQIVNGVSSLMPQNIASIVLTSVHSVGLLVLFTLVKIRDFVPNWAGWWLTAFSEHPLTSLFLALFVAWLFFLKSSALHRTIDERSEWAWYRVKNNTHPQAPKETWSDMIASSLSRKCDVCVNAYRFVARGLGPFLFAWTIAPALILLILIKLKYEDVMYRRS